MCRSGALVRTGSRFLCHSHPALLMSGDTVMRRSTVGILVAAGIAMFSTLAVGDPPLAVGRRVSVNFAGGKEGTVVKIGTAADGTNAGGTRIHFDYEGPDPTTGQWFCAWNSPLTITPLGGAPA